MTLSDYILNFEEFKKIYNNIDDDKSLNKYCCSCGVVLTHDNISNKKIKPIKNYHSIIKKQYCCKDCENDIDENGYFVEEILWRYKK